MLRVTNLWVQYGRIQAVRGVSLEVAAGEIVGLIGPNGAGKSTTLLTIAGALRAVRGEIVFENERINGHAPEDILRRGIAIVPESRRIFSGLTVAENLRLGATVTQDRRRVSKDIDWAFERFPALQRYAASSARNLSGGEQQQLAIARALMSRPRLVLMDEPSLGLAPVIVDEVFRILAELRETGMTVLLVEQNAARTLEVASRMYVMQAGEIRLTGAADELADVGDFHEHYLGV